MLLDRPAFTDAARELRSALWGAFVRPGAGDALRMHGADARDLLHRLGSAAVLSVEAGGVRETLLTTEKGRVLDALLVAPTDDHLLLLPSAGGTERVRSWLEKYTIMEDCTYVPAVDDFAQFDLIGDPSCLPAVPEPWRVCDAGLGGASVRLLRHESVTGAAVRVLAAPADAAAVWDALTALAPPVGSAAFAAWRVHRRLPAVGKEIGLHANPLESGAEAAVDFRKGCYIGQEVIARLDSYDKVQRTLARLRALPGATLPEEGSALSGADGEAGLLTTVAVDPTDGAVLALGLVRRGQADAGTELTAVDGGAVFTVW